LVYRRSVLRWIPCSNTSWIFLYRVSILKNKTGEQMSDNRIILPGQQQQEQNPLGVIMQQIGMLSGFCQQIEQALIGLSHEVKAQGLGFQMVLNMFENKGLFAEDEIKELCKVHISTPMAESIKALEEQMQAAQGQAQDAAAQAAKLQVAAEEAAAKADRVIRADGSVDGEKQVTIRADGSILPEEDVKLASEKNNVIRFPNGKKE